MTPEQIGQLTTGILSTLGAIAAAFTALAAWLESRKTTKIAAKVEGQTNGRLKATEDALAKERDKVVGLVGALRNYRELLARIQAEHPDTGPTIARWMAQRTAPIRSEDIEALAARLAPNPEEPAP